MLTDTDPRVIEAKLAKLNKNRTHLIPSKTIRSMIRHGQLDQLERFTVCGVQAITVEARTSTVSVASNGSCGPGSSSLTWRTTTGSSLIPT